MSEVRGGGRGELPHAQCKGSGQEEQSYIQGQDRRLVQGEEQQLCFAGAAMKRYPTSKVR